ncbi:extensin family protein [Pontixanthobacter aquaemixtae]|uniref:Extensin-like C-terminal domain-containing protein n=1 Tax=Pontixanthobacter aquaemixtae TaxID=1958940 RepID=A0A844ZUK5_9SPHN|nr:extensin family protein [Pontixanthobacter aquaemixtae]MXO90800.1 hypothetical protein [Pontixanthobacter aquaemixtae]
MADIRIDNLAGKPLLYDRSVTGHYGVAGVPFSPFIESGFAAECEACFTEVVDKLKQFAGLKVDKILSGGVSRAGSGSSLHHQNRAFDLDAFLFDDGSNWVTDTFPQRPQLYLGIEAILRRHFGTVLSYDYNRAHQDHFHFDNGTSVKFKSAAKSHVIFLQNVISLIYQTPIGRDGVWGPQTDGEVRALRSRLGIGPISDTSNWKALLEAIAKDALENEKATTGDLEVLEPEFCLTCGQLIE